MKTVIIIPVVIGALGIVTKNLENYLSKIDFAPGIEPLQKTCLLGTARVRTTERGGVAGATAPGPGPRQGPVKKNLCFSCNDVIKLGLTRGPESRTFFLKTAFSNNITGLSSLFIPTLFVQSY